MYTGLQKGLSSGDVRGSYKGLDRGQYKGLYHDNAIIDRETIAWLQQVDKRGYPRPSWRYITCLNSLIVSLKLAGIWSQLDRFWVFAAEQRGHARISIVNPGSTPLSEVNSPGFMRYVGYKGDGTSSYLNTNYIASNSSLVTPGNFSYGVYITSSFSTQGVEDVGSSDGTNIYQATANYPISGGVDIGEANSLITDPTATGARAIYVISNTLTSLSSYRNGSATSTVSGTLSAVTFPAFSFFIGARNTSGTASLYSARPYGLAYFGTASINQTNVNTILRTFSTKLGF